MLGFNWLVSSSRNNTKYLGDMEYWIVIGWGNGLLLPVWHQANRETAVLHKAMGMHIQASEVLTLCGLGMPYDRHLGQHWLR